MTYRFDGYNYVLRLNKDELLVQTLTTFAKEQKLASMWLNGLGGAQWAELGFYKLDEKQYQFKKITELVEITSLQGNLAWVDNEPTWHIHGTFSKLDMSAIGGHVKELAVGGTCELLLHAIQGDRLTRTQDDAIGLKLITV